MQAQYLRDVPEGLFLMEKGNKTPLVAGMDHKSQAEGITNEEDWLLHESQREISKTNLQPLNSPKFRSCCQELSFPFASSNSVAAGGALFPNSPSSTA